MMTPYEEDLIFKERMKNERYRTIAKQLSHNESAIRTYCSRHGLTDSDISQISECCFCHKQIIQKKRGSKRIFCDEKCRSAWRRAHHKLKEPVYYHTCVGCGAEFETAGNKSQRYCSRQCYMNHRKGNAV